jgi:hypothetical protein
MGPSYVASRYRTKANHTKVDNYSTSLRTGLLMVIRERVIPIITRPEFRISTVVVAPDRQCLRGEPSRP